MAQKSNTFFFIPRARVYMWREIKEIKKTKRENNKTKNNVNNIVGVKGMSLLR